MRRLLAVLTRAALRLLIALMIPAGGAALLAVGFLMLPASLDMGAWLTPVRHTALAVGFTFLGAAIWALGVLPSQRELSRSVVDASEPALPSGVVPVLAALAGFSAWQFPTLLAWWAETQRLVEQLSAGDSDPIGLWIIPATVVTAPPFIASLTCVLFILTAVAVAAAPRPALARRVLRACVLLQGGLVIGSSLALPPIRSLAARILALAASGPDEEVVAQMTEVLTRQAVFTTGVLFRFQWIFGGTLLATAATWYGVPAGNAVADTGAASEITPPVVAVRDEEVLRAPAATVTALSTMPSVFDTSLYRVRLLTPWILAAFRLGHLDYAITPMPARANDSGFSFSGSNGVLRREPTGTPLLTVQPTGGIWPFRSSYAVTDTSSGGIIAILESAGKEWNVLDGSRRPLAQVEHVEGREGYCQYRMRVDQIEVCRFTWTMHGLGVWTAEMDVEFSDRAAGRCDPSWAMALAPILEAQARRSSQWRS